MTASEKEVPRMVVILTGLRCIGGFAFLLEDAE
jgi:hypothetical protein